MKGPIRREDAKLEGKKGDLPAGVISLNDERLTRPNDLAVFEVIDQLIPLVRYSDFAIFLAGLIDGTNHKLA